MDPETFKVAKRIGKQRGIPAEVKKIGNFHYLYRSTTAWDRKKKRRVKFSEYIGRINEHGLIERYRRTIYEFVNSELLLSVAGDPVPELKHSFPEHWSEILALSVVRAQDARPIKLMKSA